MAASKTKKPASKTKKPAAPTGAQGGMMPGFMKGKKPIFKKGSAPQHVM